MLVNNVLAKMATMSRISSIRSAISSSLDGLNCVRIALVDEYFPETRTARVRLVNKLYMGTTENDVQKTAECPPLYVKVMFIGTPGNGIDFKISQGDECLVLFSDRELQSWWETGEVCQLDDFRTHNMSDGIAIMGIRSMPNTTATNGDLNIYSQTRDVNVKASGINMEAPAGVNIKAPDVNIEGNLNVSTGISASVPCGSVTLTFSNGILTGVS